MAVSFSQLVSRCRQQAMGYALDQAPQSELSADMAPDDTSFTVDPASLAGGQLSRGIVEIDDELILVKSYDKTSGLVQVLGGPNGRGVEGTTPTAHSAQALVTTSPRFPRTRIKEAINQTIAGVYPDVVVFDTYEFTRLMPVYEYELPADVDDVWYVTAQMIGPSQVWYPLPNWRYNPMADPTAFPSGKSIQQLDYVTPGRAVRVVYAKPPTLLSADDDDFETTTGYPERIVDLITYGVLKRILPAWETARLQSLSVESTNRSQVVATGSAARAVQLYEALYEQRLAEERALMFSNVPNFQAFQGS